MLSDIHQTYHLLDLLTIQMVKISLNFYLGFLKTKMHGFKKPSQVVGTHRTLKFDTDWACFDGELMPWSAKAKELLIKQYAAVGCSVTTSLPPSISSCTKKGIATNDLIEKYTTRKQQIEKYITYYRNYCR